MVKRSSLLVVAALTLLAGTAGYTQSEQEAAVVEVAKANIARVAPRRWVPGGVVSRNDARLATSAEGRLEYVAEVGTRVRAGDRVAKLEDESVKLRVEDAKAAVARIEAQRGMPMQNMSALTKPVTVPAIDLRLTSPMPSTRMR